jgi:hypothetical protein
MPFDPDGAFAPADPAQSARIRALPRIIVHPKPPPSEEMDNRQSGTASDGPDDWFVPSADGYPDDWFVPSADGYPDDWFVPAQSATPAAGQPVLAAQPNVTNPTLSNPPAAPRDPFAAYWSLIPASRVGAMAWDPPNLPLFGPLPSTNNFPAPSLPPAWPVPAGSRRPTLGVDGLPWSSTQSLPSPAIPEGGLFGGLARLGTPPPPTWPEGGLLGGLARLGSASPGAGEFPSLQQPQSANASAVAPDGRRPLSNYSAGEIAGDAAKSFGVGVGRFAIDAAGLSGDAREMLANGVQRAADYLAPGSAPNAGSNVSQFLSSYPLLAGPTSSQLQNTVESYTGPFYQPKTIVGDYAQTAGEFVPGALAMPGGGLARSALRYGLLPALSSETAGQLTKGTAAEPWARTLGAILGAAPSAWRDLPWARSAPDAALTIEQELAALSDRANQIHGALGKIAQSRRTTAVLSTDGDTIVAGGKRDLAPIQKALVRLGERAAKLPGAHAETTALSEAQNAGLTPRALATSRPICPECRATIEDAGGVLTSKSTAVFPR